MISIEAVLADEPLAKTSRVRLTTLVGSIRAGGFTAAIFAAKSEAGAVLINAVDAPSIDLRSTTGSLTAKDISSKEFSSFSSAGSIHLENVTAERVDSESMAGTIIVTTVNVRSLALLSSSGSVRVKDAVVADTASLVSGSGSISADGFSGRFKYLTGKTRAGSVHVSNLLMDPAIPSNVEVESSSGSVAVEATDFLGKFLIKSDFGSVSVSGSHLTLDRTKSQINGTRGYGDDFIHGLAAVTVVGSTRAAFL
ncbi:hypothetical protein DFJ73DRAFT_869144 [Zopfochytrium polystomum]|nr:hypothetical protein DFJ73DRAFT_869144 [Zopfochytrium polystomum]